MTELCYSLSKYNAQYTVDFDAMKVSNKDGGCVSIMRCRCDDNSSVHLWYAIGGVIYEPIVESLNDLIESKYREYVVVRAILGKE